MRNGLLLKILIALSLTILATHSTWGAPMARLHYPVMGQDGFSLLDPARDPWRWNEDEVPIVVPIASPKVMALVHEGKVALAEDRLANAANSFQEALDQVRPARDPITYAGLLTFIGIAQLRQHDVNAAEQRFTEAQSVLEAHIPDAPAHMTFLKVGQAGAAQARDDRDRVEQLVHDIQHYFPPRVSPPDLLHFLSRVEIADYLRLVNLPKAAEPYMRATVQTQEAHPELAPDLAADLSLQFASVLGGLHKGELGNLGPDGKPTDNPSEIERYAARAVQLLGGRAASGPLAEMALELAGREQLIRKAWVPALESLQHARGLGQGRFPADVPLALENAELAEALAGQNRLPEALNALDEAIGIDQSLLPATRTHLAQHLRRKAELQCANLHCVPALESAQAAEAMLMTLSDPLALAQCRSALAAILQVAGTPAQAQVANQGALEHFTHADPTAEAVGLLHQQRGEILLAQHAPAAALEEFEAARTIFSHLQPASDRAVVEMKAYEAVSRYEQGDTMEALGDARAQIDVYQRNQWPWSLGIAAAVRVMGLNALEAHDTVAAVTELAQAWDVRRRAVTGGEVTIAQGWELAQLLSRFSPAVHDAVIERLYEMLPDSPAVSAELRAQVTKAWSSAQCRRGTAPAYA